MDAVGKKERQVVSVQSVAFAIFRFHQGQTLSNNLGQLLREAQPRLDSKMCELLLRVYFIISVDIPAGIS